MTENLSHRSYNQSDAGGNQMQPSGDIRLGLTKGDHEKGPSGRKTDTVDAGRFAHAHRGLASEGGNREDIARRLGMRLLRVIVLAACYFVLELVAKTLTVAQFIFCAWKKRPHRGMQRLGEMIARYMQQMWLYCTFASDEAPWPFSPWPRVQTL